MNATYLYTPIGTLRIQEENEKIISIAFTRGQKKFRMSRKTSPTLQHAMQELAEYFTGKRKTFDMPITLAGGTPFQQTVWKALQEIPFGQTRSYGDIAKAIGRPKAVRAVGTAIGANPLLLVVPCHRVIKKTGAIGKFAAGVTCKRGLLAQEGIEL